VVLPRIVSEIAYRLMGGRRPGLEWLDLHNTIIMNPGNQIVLPDGRKLSFAEFGTPNGFPVMYFHGAPSSRMEPLLLGESWARAGLRVIAPDRPGMGGSDYLAGREFSDWPRDVNHLANSLGWKRFSVLGFSGGGANVAVCAARIPERLNAAVIVSGGWNMTWPEARKGLPFVNRITFILARRAPVALRMLLSSMGRSSSGSREQELADMKKRFAPADCEALEVPGRLEALDPMIREALRQGTKGAAWDMRLYVRDFDFRLDEIQMPLHVFHGELDMNAPIALVRRAIAEIPNAKLTAYANDAHFSTFLNHFDDFAHLLIDAA
jgi:pimeloyl-ACP methyl ester carboxylesterase